MGESQLEPLKPEIYERLLDRLGLALDVARTAARLRDEMPAELELRGLSRAEFDVIRAYLASLPEGAPGRAEAMQQAQPPSRAKVVWLKQAGRSTHTEKPGKLHCK